MQGLETGLDLESMLGSMGPMLIWLAVGHIYFAICLSLIAKKTGTPQAWMAWFPLFNLVLFCRAGGKSAGWFILLLLPLLNVIFILMIWAGIAQRRGKAGWTVMLLFVPIVNVFVPAYYAAGPVTAPPQPTSDPGTRTPSAAPPSNCPECKEPLEAGDAFCPECGTSLAPVAAPAPMAAPAGVSAGCMVFLVLLLVLLGGGAWLFFGPTKKYAQPNRQPVQMPQRMAGTLKEFPVDTAQDAVAQPVTVSSQSLDAADGATGLKAPPNSLPPGLDAGRIRDQGTAMSSAVYKTSPDAPSVHVHVVQVGENARNAQPIIDQIGAAVGGEADRITVTSPSGGTYDGFRFQRLTQLVILLLNHVNGTLTIVFSDDPGSFEVATRLASHVGNGNGLMDYPSVAVSLGALPAAPPVGLTLADVTSFRGSDLQAGLDTVSQASSGADMQVEVSRALGKVKELVPDDLVLGTYKDEQAGEWGIALGHFNSPRTALNLWWLLKYTIGLGMDKVSVDGQPGLFVSDDTVSFLICHKGPYLWLSGGPANATVEEVIALAKSCQL